MLLCDFELFDFDALCMRPELPLLEPEPDIEPEVEPMVPEPEVELIEPEPDVLPIEPEPEVVEPEVLPIEPEVLLPLVEPEVLPIEPEVLPLVEPDVLPPPVVLPVVVWAKAVPEVRAKPKTKATA